MSELDALLARSREPGRLTQRRRFSLARGRAIEKMREFTLRHPEQYLLEVLQGAVLSGATWVAVDVTDQRVVIGWVGGRAIKPEEAEHLFDALFFDQADASRRHLMQLAVGVNALLQRKPPRLWIESGDGSEGGTVRLTFAPNGEAEVGRPELPLAGTYLVAEFDTLGWLPRFFRSKGRQEQGTVESRCLYTPVPILLNGTAPFGYRANRDTRLFGVPKQYEVKGEGRRGAVAPAAAGMQSELRLVVGGVWVSSRDLEGVMGAPVIGVVADDSLRKTADMSDIVEDDRYAEVLHAVAEALRPALTSRSGGFRPKLPPRVVPVASASDVVSAKAAPRVVREPLPDPIPQLGARPSLSAALLADRGEGAPLFVVDEDVGRRLARALDPLVFPWPVLVLSEGQAASLADLLPELAPSRIRGAPDVAFLDRVLLQHQRHVEVTCSVGLVPGAILRLRRHTHGAVPDWALAARGVPTAVRYNDAVITVLAAGVDVPGLSAVLELGQQPLQDVQLDRVAPLIADNLWRLLPADAEARRDPAWRPLLTTILALHARPFFVRTGETVGLTVALPERWVAADLLLLPLADTPDGPLTGADFVALLGQDAVRVIPDPAERAALGALERRLGFGHLRGPAESGQALAMVGLRGGRWVNLRDGSTEDPYLDAVIWLHDAFDAALDDPAWRALPRPNGLFGAFAREGVEVDQDSLYIAYNLLYGKCASYYERAHGGEGAMRRELLEIAALALSAWLGFPAPRLRDTTGAPLRDLRQARFIAANGVHLAEPGTVALTFDALRALCGPTAEGRPASPPALRLDDAPEVWSPKADSAPEGWLLRRPVRFGLVSGWVGLRQPFDASMGVLLEDAGGLRVIGSGLAETTFHGWLWDESGGVGLSSDFTEALAAAGLLLYHELIEGLRGDYTAETRSCALAYAEAYVEAWLVQHAELPVAGVPRTLATLVGLHATGEAASRARAWVARAAPEEAEGRSASLDGFAATLKAELAPRYPLLELRVVAVGPLGVLIDRWPLREGETGITLAVWPHHALVRRALAGEALAQDLLLLAACPHLVRALRMGSGSASTAELQALMLARQLAGRFGWAPAAPPRPAPHTRPPPPAKPRR